MVRGEYRTIRQIVKRNSSQELNEIVGRIARRRTAEKIVEEILSLAIDGVGKTTITYQANLNFTRSTKYIDMLIRQGLLKKVEASERYETTEKGLEYLDLRRKMRVFHEF